MTNKQMAEHLRGLDAKAAIGPWAVEVPEINPIWITDGMKQSVLHCDDYGNSLPTRSDVSLIVFLRNHALEFAAALEEVAQARELLRECERRMEYSGFPDCAGGIRYRIAKFLA